MQLSKLIYSLFLAIIILPVVILPATVFAQSGIKTDSPHYGDKGWDFELGAGVYTFNEPIYLDNDTDGNSGLFPIINLSYFDDRFHFVLNQEEDLLLGYTLYRQQNWAADIVLSPRLNGPDNDNKTLKFLDERKIDLHTGLRWSLYGENDRIIVEASRDISGRHGGFILNTEFQQEWQIKNWLLSGRVGVSYLSEKLVDYYIGVDASEAQTDFPRYQAKAAFLYSIGLKAEYPLSEYWVFQALAGVTHLDKKITKSPISSGESLLSIATVGVTYHF